MEQEGWCRLEIGFHYDYKTGLIQRQKICQLPSIILLCPCRFQNLSLSRLPVLTPLRVYGTLSVFQGQVYNVITTFFFSLIRQRNKGLQTSNDCLSCWVDSWNRSQKARLKVKQTLLSAAELPQCVSKDASVQSEKENEHFLVHKIRFEGLWGSEGEWPPLSHSLEVGCTAKKTTTLEKCLQLE